MDSITTKIKIKMLTKKIANDLPHKLYAIIADEMAYSDIDLEGDKFNDAHGKILEQVLFLAFEKSFQNKL